MNSLPHLQYVYRLTIGPTSSASLPVEGFQFFTNPWQLVGSMARLWQALGWKGILRTAAKLMTSRRFFFIVLLDLKVAHHGWITIGRCRYYPVEPEAVVVGPVETSREFQGRGFATVGLSGAISEMAARGIRILYIDTADTNLPMQRVIEKCGFGKPVSTYVRPEKGL